jgi:signal transduction histidine kinase
VNVTVTSETDYAVVSVADTGIGIPAEEQSRIFEAFQQVETPARVKPEGTGLGLAICHELCVILGCGMTLESMPGRGSTFTLSVPKVFAALEVNEV